MGLVHLDSGPITGAQQANIWSYKGIPYAAPPVGNLRWKPPQPVAAWTSPRACTSYGPACPQPTGGELLPSLAVGATSEDCLYLNVWSPAHSPSQKLPVMVWIHGGSFVTGAGSLSVYDGANLAGKGVVVVTINYRLGPLGFLALPALSKESPQGVSGNYGLLDQIAALRWVQKNIAGFGGDSARVTVFGESAGAISVLDLMVSSLAKGLFQRAIAESGILLDRGFGVKTAGTLAQAEADGQSFAKKLGVDPNGDVAAAMRAKSPAELLAAAQGGAGLTDIGLPWRPVADGYVLTDLPTVLWATGKELPVPLLLGTNADEGNAFLSEFPSTVAGYTSTMDSIFGTFEGQALALYPAKNDAEVKPTFSRVLTEVGFAGTARFVARSLSGSASSPSKVFLYQFTHVPLNNPLGAFHSVEIPYVFGNISLFAGTGTVDQQLSAAIMGYWTRFAATGDPNGGGATVWPAYASATDQNLQLGDAISVGSGLYRQACDLADQVRSSK